MNEKTCEHCAKGSARIKLRRQFIHRVGWRNIVCTEENESWDAIENVASDK